MRARLECREMTGKPELVEALPAFLGAEDGLPGGPVFVCGP